jgi:hypothetical protein
VDNGKLLTLFVAMLAIFALYLNTKNQLIPVLDALAAPPAAGSNVRPLSEYIIAIFLMLILFSVLPGNTSLVLAAIILLGALLEQTKSGHNVLTDLGI